MITGGVAMSYVQFCLLSGQKDQDFVLQDM